MDKQEKIVCAAVRFVKTKYVVYGAGYDSIQKSEVYIRIFEEVICPRIKYGFLTTKRPFVDAKEAMEIAIKCGQVDMYLHSKQAKRDLKPEDLY